jgi:hypothetical protein
MGDEECLRVNAKMYCDRVIRIGTVIYYLITHVGFCPHPNTRFVVMVPPLNGKMSR